MRHQDWKQYSVAEKKKFILTLSKKKFEWKTTGNIDSIENLFSDELVFVHITGHITTKHQWISELRSGRFSYEKIVLKQADAMVFEDTAVVSGRASFTVNGDQVYKLVYSEVYALSDDKWKLVVLHTTLGHF